MLRAGKEVIFDQVLMLGEGESLVAGSDAADATVSGVVTEEGREQENCGFQETPP